MTLSAISLSILGISKVESLLELLSDEVSVVVLDEVVLVDAVLVPVLDD